MPIVYDKMLKLMEEKGITSYVCKRDNIIGQATYKKIKSGGDIDTRTIAKMCEVLECQPSDLMEYVPDDEITVRTETIRFPFCNFPHTFDKKRINLPCVH